MPAAPDTWPLGTVWVVGLSACSVISFVVGYAGFLNAAVVPAEAYSIAADLHGDQWRFTYPNATSSSRLVVPAARPVEIVLTADRGVHRLTIPDFRATAEIVAGQPATIWFAPTEPGDVIGICGEHGANVKSHAHFVVSVLTALEFSRWAEGGGDEGASVPPEQKGKRLFASLGCGACHADDAKAATAPTLAGIFGRKETMSGGASVSVDEAYVRESIVSPAAKVVRGYQPVMPDLPTRSATPNSMRSSRT